MFVDCEKSLYNCLAETNERQKWCLQCVLCFFVMKLIRCTKKTNYIVCYNIQQYKHNTVLLSCAILFF